MTTIIYHNPRCSKSRQTLALLKENNVEPTVIEYLKNPPSETELKHILELLNIPAKDLLRTKEACYKELAINADKLSDKEIIKIMCANPILIERPIVVEQQKAVLGRPPENVLTII